MSVSTLGGFKDKHDSNYIKSMVWKEWQIGFSVLASICFHMMFVSVHFIVFAPAKLWRV